MGVFSLERYKNILLKIVGGTTMGTQASIAVGAVFIVSFVAVGAISYQALNEQLDSIITNEQNIIVGQAAEAASQRIQTIQRALLTSANNIRSEDLVNPEIAQRLLDSNHGLAGLFDRSVFIFSADGTLLAERPYKPGRVGTNGRFRPYIALTLDSLKPVISEPFVTNSGDNNVVVVLTMPILTKDGKLMGMISGSLGLTRPDVLGSFENIVIGRTGSIAITTFDGKVIVGKDKTRISSSLYPAGSNALFTKALAGFEGTEESFSDDGRPAYVTYKKVPESGWIIRGVYPKEEATEFVKNQARKGLWLLVGLTICLLGMTMVIARYLTKPLMQLSKHIAAYSGAAGHIKPLSCIRGALEVRSLTVAFNAMTQQLIEREELVVTRQRMEVQNAELRHLASRDALTGCLNRRAFFEQAGELFLQAKAQYASYCCLMVDIDHFKQFNDLYGHSVGDQVIQAVAKALAGALRPLDILCRYGGEEFCIVLPNISLEGAAAVAERIRAHIEAHANDGVQGNDVKRVTSSFGVATLSQGAITLEELIDQADQALYLSKQQGRNRVTVWSRPA